MELFFETMKTLSPGAETNNINLKCNECNGNLCNSAKSIFTAVYVIGLLIVAALSV